VLSTLLESWHYCGQGCLILSVASIITIFGGEVNRNSIVPNVLIITITYPLHLSVEYIYIYTG
jgi:hypothetical protein